MTKSSMNYVIIRGIHVCLFTCLARICFSIHKICAHYLSSKQESYMCHIRQVMEFLGFLMSVVQLLSTVVQECCVIIEWEV